MGDIKSLYGDGGASQSERAGMSKAVGELNEFQYVNPPGLFDGSSVFTQVIVAPRGRTVAIAGLIGCNTDNILVADDHEGQIQKAFENLKVAIESAGVTPSCVVKICEYVVDYSQDHLGIIIQEIHKLFEAGKYPANTLVPVPRLGRDGALFEIDALAVMPD